MPPAFGPAGEQNATPPAEVQDVSMAASLLSLISSGFMVHHIIPSPPAKGKKPVPLATALQKKHNFFL